MNDPINTLAAKRNLLEIQRASLAPDSPAIPLYTDAIAKYNAAIETLFAATVPATDPALWPIPLDA